MGPILFPPSLCIPNVCSTTFCSYVTQCKSSFEFNTMWKINQMSAKVEIKNHDQAKTILKTFPFINKIPIKKELNEWINKFPFLKKNDYVKCSLLCEAEVRNGNMFRANNIHPRQNFTLESLWLKSLVVCPWQLRLSSNTKMLRLERDP